ncbi:MAG: hypothetical protein HY074_09750 [Deltaproteobacteria bacterium]|nr:hypothetical protein [Deltaproteobacteria bacterium]
MNRAERTSASELEKLWKSRKTMAFIKRMQAIEEITTMRENGFCRK